jgi:hypothetical protein
MSNEFRAAVVVGLSLWSTQFGLAQAPKPKISLGTQVLSPCDLNFDGVVNLLDIQTAVNMALKQASCTADVTAVGVCDIVLIQRVANAVQTGACITGTTVHSVTLSWTASTSSNIAGYNVYRGTVSGGPYAKISTFPINGTTFTDPAAQAGATYYYVTTAVDTSNNESVYSNEAKAVIPYP